MGDENFSIKNKIKFFYSINLFSKSILERFLGG